MKDADVFEWLEKKSKNFDSIEIKIEPEQQSLTVTGMKYIISVDKDDTGGEERGILFSETEEYPIFDDDDREHCPLMCCFISIESQLKEFRESRIIVTEDWEGGL